VPERLTVKTSSGARSRSRVDPRIIWSAHVVACLREAGVASPVQGDDRPSAWRELQHGLRNKCLALALVRPAFSPDPLTYLGPQQQEIRRLWLQMLRASHPLLFLEFVEVVQLGSPADLHVVGAPNYSAHVSRSRSLVFQVTPACGSRLMRCTVCNESVESVVARWSDQYPLCPELPPTLAIAVPTPHALLLGLRRWRFHALPMPTGDDVYKRSIRSWIGAGRLFNKAQGIAIQEVDDNNLEHESDSPLWALTPDKLQRCADLTRLAS
jgi:hypothetical protein